MSDLEKDSGENPKKLKDKSRESSPDPKATMVPDFGALLKQTVEGSVKESEEGKAPELKKGKRSKKRTMVPTYEDLAELTRQTVLEEAAKKEEEEAEEAAEEEAEKQEAKRKIIVPLEDLREGFDRSEKDDS